MGKLAANLRYALGLRGFLRDTLTIEEASSVLRERLGVRGESFLSLIEKGVYNNPISPYLRLLRHAGYELADLRRLVAERGVEGALNQLYDAGVYVSLEEFKGRRAIRRGSLEFSVTPDDFANPFIAGTIELQSSGSRGAPSRAQVDLAYMRNEALYLPLVLEGQRVGQMPYSHWGLGGANLMILKTDREIAGSFSNAPFSWRPGEVRGSLLQKTMRLVTRLLGTSLPEPEFVPRDEVVRIARWLAERTASGKPSMLWAMASPVTRICLAAREHGLAISGTVFRVAGEPYTQGKADVIASVGARAFVCYTMLEMGSIGHSCANPAELDDVHVCIDKLAVIQRDKLTTSGETVGALIYTTLLPNGPRLMLNVESGDHGKLSERDCGCPLGELGFGTHLSGIRSYEKLTSEGVTFAGSRLFEVIETLLPARFGGTSLDYQIVEEEEEGVPRVSIVVAPGVGAVDDAAVIATVLESLSASHEGGRHMTNLWQQSKTLRVVRREPYETRTAKVQPLHVVRPAPVATPREATKL